jgi:general L-amino acid transport system substrate-binding protein
MTMDFRAFILAGTVLAATVPAGAGTLDDVRARGTLTCGVSTGLLGFSEQKPDGSWAGFDVDFCRAVAAVIFGDPGKVRYVPLSATVRFEALKAGQVDLLSRNSTWTLDREAGLGLLFAGVNFYDGQGFMVRRENKAITALELTKASVCVQAGTTAALGVGEFFTTNSITAEIKTFPDGPSTLKGFESGACDVMTADNSGLFAERLRLARASEATILPDIISKEPLGPVVRNDDVRWYTLIRWINFALINAEELGINTANIADAKRSTKPDVRRFMGVEGDLGSKMGVTADWAARAVAAVGNYGEVYERNVGTRSRLGIPRGLNQLWSEGGILYAPPIR